MKFWRATKMNYYHCPECKIWYCEDELDFIWLFFYCRECGSKCRSNGG